MDKLRIPVIGDIHVDASGALDLSGLVPQKVAAATVFTGGPAEPPGLVPSEQGFAVMTHVTSALEKRHALVSQMDLALAGDADALAKVHAALDAGLFNTALVDIPAMVVGGLTASDVLNSQGPLFDAFLGSYGEARFTKVLVEAGFPVFPEPILVALPHGAPAFAPVLSKVFDSLVRMDEAMQAQVPVLEGDVRTELFAKALAMACKMGMPDAIGPLAARCPQALRKPLSIGDTMQSAWSKHMSLGQTQLATPAFFAVQYGHPECLDALRKAGLERQFCLTHSKNLGSGALTPIPQHEFFSTFALSILPSQLPAVLERMDHKVVSKNPGMKAIEAPRFSSQPQRVYGSPSASWDFGPPKTLRTFIPVFLEAGTFDKIPVADVIRAACVNNVPEVVDFFVGKAPWQNMDSGLITDVAISMGSVAEDGALVALLKAADEQGQLQMFAPYESSDRRQADPTNHYQPQEDYDVSVTEPAFSVIRAGMRETLVLVMKNGLDPEAKDDFNTSPLDVAREMRRPDMEHVMRTFLSRNAVLGILDQIDAPDAGPISKNNTKPSP